MGVTPGISEREQPAIYRAVFKSAVFTAISRRSRRPSFCNTLQFFPGGSTQRPSSRLVTTAPGSCRVDSMRTKAHAPQTACRTSRNPDAGRAAWPAVAVCCPLVVAEGRADAEPTHQHAGEQRPWSATIEAERAGMSRSRTAGLAPFLARCRPGRCGGDGERSPYGSRVAA